MSKRGIVLLLALVVFLVLSVLAAAFFTRSISENNLVRRQVASTQALWYAEEGIARGIAQLTSSMAVFPILVTGSDSTVSGYDAEIQSSSDEPCGKAFQIVSTGSVFLGTSPITRTIESFVCLEQLTGSGFEDAIEVNGPLNIKPNPPKVFPDDTYAKELAGVSFTTRFGFTSDELRAYAQSIGRYYEDPSAPLASIPNDYPVTWYKITDPTKKLQVPRNGWTGTGIMVVEGNCDIEGGEFRGIIWVIGELKIAGNVVTFGAVISECDTEVTTDVTGTPALTWNQAAIDAAIQGPGDALAGRTPLSWRELP
jgi:hypothetical protein